MHNEGKEVKVAHLSYSDQSGGAAMAGWRVHRGVCERGISSRMFVVDKKSDDEDVVTPSGRCEKMWNRVAPWLDSIPPRFSSSPCDKGLRSTAWFSSTIPAMVRKFEPDLVHLGWVASGVMRIEGYSRLQVPIVWRLCDMWPFAGAEHYVGESTRFLEGYSRENRPPEMGGFDVDRWVWSRKKRHWRSLRDLHFVAPSKWMERQVRESAIFRDAKVSVIHTGVDTSVFQRQSQEAARADLGLPNDVSLILFAAQAAVDDPRKGFQFMAEALSRVAATGRKASLLVVGSSVEKGDLEFPFPVISFPPTSDRSRMASIYAAADVFVAPSMQENLANTVLEALACGVPCVAFRIGGMPDVINHQENGWLAEPFSPQDLAVGISWILDNQERAGELSDNAEQTIREGFTMDRQADQFASLYREILRQSNSRNK